eukprot:CAMPEP_0184708148 /NCGR_PEP_ID=MMETSP0313-20130426/37630_1 /TAXON_ID=2792 /ORGANISM="Porphyridium aerugineum, Strain SAG 1380-2" /LENGTH=454 /DNA_ID=CAMNT_0027169731 /DNA_START=123 /DNA_END=1487 /DNA_ORIENTATION=-
MASSFTDAAPTSTFDCHGCGLQQQGTQNHCLVCRDYVLCSECAAARVVTESHQAHHPLIPLSSSLAYLLQNMDPDQFPANLFVDTNEFTFAQPQNNNALASPRYQHDNASQNIIDEDEVDVEDECDNDDISPDICSMDDERFRGSFSCGDTESQMSTEELLEQLGYDDRLFFLGSAPSARDRDQNQNVMNTMMFSGGGGAGSSAAVGGGGSSVGGAGGGSSTSIPGYGAPYPARRRRAPSNASSTSSKAARYGVSESVLRGKLNAAAAAAAAAAATSTSHQGDAGAAGSGSTTASVASRGMAPRQADENSDSNSNNDSNSLTHNNSNNASIKDSRITHLADTPSGLEGLQQTTEIPNRNVLSSSANEAAGSSASHAKSPLYSGSSRARKQLGREAGVASQNSASSKSKDKDPTAYAMKNIHRRKDFVKALLRSTIEQDFEIMMNIKDNEVGGDS